jgi:hypothetical protein
MSSVNDEARMQNGKTNLCGVWRNDQKKENLMALLDFT